MRTISSVGPTPNHPLVPRPTTGVTALSTSARTSTRRSEYSGSMRMSETREPTPFGRSNPPNEAWLAQQPSEPILDPDLPIIDTHHHLWQRPQHRYLLDDLLADLRRGHNVVATVFAECHSMYRADGPEAFRPVGETEFVTGIAAMSASGLYGPIRVAAGIVGFADLTLGDRVEPVLEALIRAGGGRFRGVRHSAAWDASEVIGNSRAARGPHMMGQADFRSGLQRLTSLGLSFDAWAFHPQLADVVDLARAFPSANIVMGHVGAPLGYGPYAGKREEVLASWKAGVTELARCDNVVMKLGGMMMRKAAYDCRTQPKPPSSAELAALWSP